MRSSGLPSYSSESQAMRSHLSMPDYTVNYGAYPSRVQNATPFHGTGMSALHDHAAQMNALPNHMFQLLMEEVKKVNVRLEELHSENRTMCEELTSHVEQIEVTVSAVNEKVSAASAKLSKPGTAVRNISNQHPKLKVMYCNGTLLTDPNSLNTANSPFEGL